LTIKGLLFDLDGVIVDTAKYHYLAWKKIANGLHAPFTLMDNERLKGVSRARSLEIILEIANLGLPEQMQTELCEQKNRLYLEMINELTADDILAGAGEFLRDAREQGYQLALGSASKNAEFILNKLGLTDSFDIIIDGTTVSKAKPDPEVFQRGARELGLNNGECLVFEDSIAGVEAAHRGGMKAVGIGSRALLPAADLHIPGFQQISIGHIVNCF
jgi:beta-phosphoglucomutase